MITAGRRAGKRGSSTLVGRSRNASQLLPMGPPLTTWRVSGESRLITAVGGRVTESPCHRQGHPSGGALFITQLLAPYLLGLL